MEWYNYLASFFAGAFLANTAPHFIKGISGDKFPTPFAKPPGKGLSSPVINVVWALFNLVVGYLLLTVAKISTDNFVSLVVFFAGIAVMSVMLANNFQHKDKE
ncbi:MAG TPA: hypothetical protein VHS53_10855 [Mucilaginibacter sp.]|nr:hypothetical protein [Mucilaginibacter sp.]